MATDSKKKLTKYKSAVTIVTADFANSIFGGLYGTSDAAGLDDDDPRVRGHVHSGEKVDGHAPKVHLVEHVEGRLENKNLADDAVMKRNVYDTINVNEAIPEYRIDGAKTYYYLDLRHIRADFVFQEDEDPAGDGSQNRNIRQRSTYFDGSAYVDVPNVWNDADGFDFVFGSSSLEDLSGGGAEGDSRFQFDKSNASFRAGSVQSDQWDEVNRGGFSAAFGLNSTASGDFSSVLGGYSNTVSANASVIAGGAVNAVEAQTASISGGENNHIFTDASVSVISGGASNSITERLSVISGGGSNDVLSEESAVSGGTNNTIESNSTASVISGGESNTIEANSETSIISGGEGSIISFGSSTSSIIGGKQNIVGDEDKSDYSLIAGGKSNKISSEASTILGGLRNNIGMFSSDSFISGGYDNNIDGVGSAIFQGNNSVIEGQHNAIVSGIESNISGDFNAIVGSGMSGDPLRIGGSYTSKMGRIIPSTRSNVSGIYGGRGCLVNAGSPDVLDPKEGNFILASVKAHMGADVEGTYVAYSNIIGSLDSEITASSGPGTVIDPVKIINSSIVGGYDNLIALGGQPNGSDVLCSGIIGGFRNSLNIRRDSSLPTPTPWFEGSGFKNTTADFGIQTSYVLGGSENCITNSVSELFEHNSLYSTIIGGNKNIISSSYGSTIIGGGVIADTSSGAKFPPYPDTNLYYPNIISESHHSSILNGSSNYISGETFPFGTHGPHWIAGSKPSPPIKLPSPQFCTAEGRESFSYLYGQKAYATGAHDWVKFYSQGFDPGAVEYSGPGSGQYEFHTVIGALWSDTHKQPDRVPGTAQTSELNFFGSYDYNKSEILDAGNNFVWKPASDWWFETKAYLDGGKDSSALPSSHLGAIPERCFIPRYIGSYALTLKGHIRYTDLTTISGGLPGGPDQIGLNHIIAFTLKAYVVFQPDGSGHYGTDLVEFTSSDGLTTLDVLGKAPTWWAPPASQSDFYIAFCPEWDTNTGTPMTPDKVHGLAKGKGRWEIPNPGNTAGDRAWPPHFSLRIINDTGVKSVTGGASGTQRRLIGESVVIKADVTEDLFFLGNYTNPVLPP